MVCNTIALVSSIRLVVLDLTIYSATTTPMQIMYPGEAQQSAPSNWRQCTKALLSPLSTIDMPVHFQCTTEFMCVGVNGYSWMKKNGE